MERNGFLLSDDELRRAAAEIDDECRIRKASPARDAAEGQERLLAPAQEARLEAERGLNACQELRTVQRVANGARCEGQAFLCAGGLDNGRVLREAGLDASDRSGLETPTGIHVLAELRDRETTIDLAQRAAFEVGDEESGGVRPEVDDRDARHLRGTRPRAPLTSA